MPVKDLLPLSANQISFKDPLPLCLSNLILNVTPVPWVKCFNRFRIPTICLSHEATTSVMFLFISSVCHENR